MYQEDFRDQGYKVLDTWQPLDFYKTNQDLRVKVSDFREPWKLSEVSSNPEVSNILRIVSVDHCSKERARKEETLVPAPMAKV